MRPVLIDLFCGAGGASVGYHRAGFDVIGVDKERQPNYPFKFIHATASEFSPNSFTNIAAIHASPPCQAFTAYRRKGMGVGEGYPDLINWTRELLYASGLPFVIENVAGAPLIDPIQLCGSSFGLDVRRHRYFESNVELRPLACDHKTQAPNRFPAATNRKPNSRATVEVGVWRIPLETQKLAMGVDWNVTLEELSEAIPPAYTRWIGGQLIRHIQMRRLAA